MDSTEASLGNTGERFDSEAETLDDKLDGGHCDNHPAGTHNLLKEFDTDHWPMGLSTASQVIRVMPDSTVEAVRPPRMAMTQRVVIR